MAAPIQQPKKKALVITNPDTGAIVDVTPVSSKEAQKPQENEGPSVVTAPPRSSKIEIKAPGEVKKDPKEALERTPEEPKKEETPKVANPEPQTPVRVPVATITPEAAQPVETAVKDEKQPSNPDTPVSQDPDTSIEKEGSPGEGSDSGILFLLLFSLFLKRCDLVNFSTFRSQEEAEEKRRIRCSGKYGGIRAARR